MSKLVTAILVPAAITVAVACRADADAPKPPPGMQLSNPSSSVTVGEIVVAASPDAVFAVLVDYANWPRVFTYLDKVTIDSQRGADAEIATRSTKGKTSRLRLHSDAAKRTLRFEEVGGRADVEAELTVTAGKAANTTAIRVRLTAVVTGVAGVFVRDSTVRAKREKKVVKDLGMLEAYFATPRK